MPDYNHLRDLIAKRLKERGDTQAQPVVPPTTSASTGKKDEAVVRVSAPTLYAALEKAADKYGCTVSDISYQILSETGNVQSGNKVIIIRAQRKQSSAIVSFDNHEEGQESAKMDDNLADARPLNTNSDFADEKTITLDETHANDTRRVAPHPAYSIKKQTGRIMVRADSQHSDFAHLTVVELQSSVESRTGHRIDAAALQKCINVADGSYHTVGYFDHDYRQDATHKVIYGLNNITASITLMPPKKNGNEYSIHRILEILKNEGIVYGINRAHLSEIEEYPLYKHPYLIAKGEAAIDGKDAQVVYSDELRIALVPANEQGALKTDGRINYKEHNNIVNVIKGTVLANLTPTEKGRDGKGVFGDVVRAKDGQAKELRVGRNVELSEDGLQAIATTDGQFRVVDNIFVIDPLYEVSGDVGIKSGNILFLGNVVVRGNVDDGFSVRASGNIEIYGFVGAAQLDSESGIKIHKGIAGKGRAFVNSGGDCVVQYIESATVHAAGSVMVGESIIQSKILAGEQVRCSGKRANIVGAEVISGMQVIAKVIGSAVGARTKISVGYDPFRLMRLDVLRARHDALSQQLSHLKRMQRKSDLHFQEGGLEYKMSKVEHIQAEAGIAEGELAILSDDIEALKEEIVADQLRGEICATNTIYQQVEVSINGVAKELRDSHDTICLIMVDDRIVSRKAEVKSG